MTDNTRAPECPLVDRFAPITDQQIREIMDCGDTSTARIKICRLIYERTKPASQSAPSDGRRPFLPFDETWTEIPCQINPEIAPPPLRRDAPRDWDSYVEPKKRAPNKPVRSSLSSEWRRLLVEVKLALAGWLLTQVLRLTPTTDTRTLIAIRQLFAAMIADDAGQNRCRAWHEEAPTDE